MPAHPARVALIDMRDAMRRIARYARGKTLTDFRRDSLIRDAVERCIEIISEASRRLPDDLKADHPEIPWPKVAAIGNLFRHEYDEVYPPLVWEIVQTDLPALRRAVNAMLRTIERNR